MFGSRFNLSSLFVRERSITLFLICLITISGVIAFLQLGRAEDPPFTIKQLTIITAWPGATPQEMQDLVTEPLEKRMQELRWYDHVETYTRPGLSYSIVSLQDGTPPEEVQAEFYQARKKINDESINLPAGIIGPMVNDEYSDVTFSLYALKVKGEVNRQLVRDAEKLRQQLLHVPGVKKVNLIGEQTENVYVSFSPEKIATLGITPQEIFSALKGRNELTPSGSFNTQGPQIFIRLNSALKDVKSIENTPIASNGKIIKLSDVAKVERGYEDPPTFIIRNNAEQALLLGVIMREGWNGLTLGKDLDKAVIGINEQLPLGMSLSKVTDQSVNIKSAVNEFLIKFFVALIVVMVVCFISMGWRAGVVVTAAVPLTLAMVFITMAVFDINLDRITLGSLILSLGLLVDDAIIAIEIMVVKMEEGLSRIKASAYAWSHTAAPMLSGTIVTAIGFMPNGFARSTTGEYTTNMFWVVGIALISSWIVAVVFTPYLGVNILSDNTHRKEIKNHYDTGKYHLLRNILTLSINKKWKTVLTVIFLFLLSIMGMSLVNKQFFPISDRPEVLVEVQMPYGTAIEETSRTVSKIEHWLLSQREAKVTTSYIGQGAPRFYLSMSPELPDPSFAKLVVLTSNDKEREALKYKLRKEISDGLANGARVRVTQLSFGPYSPYPVAFRIMGPDHEILQRIAADVESVMSKNQMMRTVNIDWGALVPVLHFSLNQDKLQSLGLTPASLSEQLEFFLSGAPITKMREDIRSIQVTGRAGGAVRHDPSLLSSLSIVNSVGKRIPLSQIGRVEVKLENPIERRRDRTPVITVRGDIDDALQPPDVSRVLLKELQPIIKTLPKGYWIEQGGAIEESEKAITAMVPLFSVLIAFTLLVIIIQVRSISAMIMVFATSPLGLVGVVPTLILFQQPFGVTTLGGLVSLSGILMRNTLILISQIDQNKKNGLSSYDAVIEATIQRSRPVILTAVAAILAFIPLTQSVFWGSLAYTLIGGTFVGTLLTLIFLPAMYAIWFNISAKDALNSAG